MWHFQFKMITCDWGKCTEQVHGFKHLLEYANRLDPPGGQPFPVPGKQPKPAFVLTIEIYFFETLPFFGDDFLTDFLEVFLKASTAFSSFFIWVLRATFILALNFLITKP